jgi:hypothetical protein
MDALYFRVSSDRQTAQNQFEDLLQVAEKAGARPVKALGEVFSSLYRIAARNRPGRHGSHVRFLKQLSGTGKGLSMEAHGGRIWAGCNDAFAAAVQFAP